MNRAHPWMLALAIGFFALALLGMLLQKDPALLGTLAFLSFAAMLIAVLEPRLTGKVSASPLSGIEVTLIDRVAAEVIQGEKELEDGELRSLLELTLWRSEVAASDVERNQDAE